MSDDLYLAYVRGQVYFAAHSGTVAAEIQKPLDHREFVLNFVIGSPAHLQIGHAYTMAGQMTKAQSRLSGFPKGLERCRPSRPCAQRSQGRIHEVQMLPLIRRRRAARNISTSTSARPFRSFLPGKDWRSFPLRNFTPEKLTIWGLGRDLRTRGSERARVPGVRVAQIRTLWSEGPEDVRAVPGAAQQKSSQRSFLSLDKRK